MRTVEYRRLLDDKNAMRIRFELEGFDRQLGEV